MKRLLLIALLFSGGAQADEYVRGYVRQDGTYVAPHYRSSPNGSQLDNYSAQGNTNPYTGQQGYQRNELSPPPMPRYNAIQAPTLSNPYDSNYYGTRR